MEWLVLGLFCGGLLLCLVGGVSILYALGGGLILFLLYGRYKGFSWRALLGMALEGMKSVKNILIIFLFIGVLTALWRAAGTIPLLVSAAARLIWPSAFLLMTFLLNCGISFLTGTSFGTVATMGVICATMGATMGVDVRLVGGAILSGIFFGDRCSPVSTSALLVAELTRTSVFDNIRRMVKTALVPFLLTCLVYGLLGRFLPQGGEIMDLAALFSREFTLHPLAALPAVVILALSLLRVNVKAVMGASILCAVPLCLFMQHRAPLELLRMAVMGFSAVDRELGAVVNGGGILSMARVGVIVCLSASYSVLFQKTHLLDKAMGAVKALAKGTNAFMATLVTSAITSMVACNQSLAILLTHQLCGGLYDQSEDLAIDMEDSVVVVAPLVPWCIAGSMPLSLVGAPASTVLLACYLYLLPLWRLLLSWRKGKKA